MAEIWDATKQKYVTRSNATATSNEPLQSGPGERFNKNTGRYEKVKPRVAKYWELGSVDPLVVFDTNTGRYAYTSSYKEPKYTFTEAMALANDGYTGLFGRSAKKQTLGLMGENWQQAYALNRYRAQQDIKPATLGVDVSPKVAKDFNAADVVAPGTKAYKTVTGLVGEFAKYGGEAKYVERYGTRPTVGTKYGILFNTNNKAARRDDVAATYQNNLVKGLANLSKDLMADTRSEADKLTGIELIKFQDYKIDLTSTRSKPNVEKIKEMENTLSVLEEQYSKPVQEAIGGTPSTAQRVATSAAAGFAATLIPGGGGAAVASAIGGTPEGNALVNKASAYMSGLADSDVLAGKSVYWDAGADVPKAQLGLVGLSINTVKGVARFGTGMPAGTIAILGEGITAGIEAKSALLGQKEFGEGTDFQVLDSAWQDYARRYYDPFAYEVDSNGGFILDAKGQKKFQGFWNGTITADNYDAFGENLSKDPVAYALDVLDVVPAIGMIAKAGSIASISRKATITGGKVGITKAEVDAATSASSVVEDLAKSSNLDEAMSIIDSLDKDPTLSKAKVEAARKVVGENATAKATLDEAMKRINAAPSPRLFRRTARAAINGEANAQALMDNWKNTMGLEFNGADNSFSVRLSAQFEERTKVLEKPESVLNASERAIVRLPASPLVRGIKEGFAWVGRNVERVAEDKILSKGEPGTVGFWIATKLIDMPLLGYRWNYTKAVQTEMVYNWGDTVSELKRASDMLHINGNTVLPAPLRQAVESALFGGTGSRGAPAGPTVQRQSLRDKLAAIPRDKLTGEVLPAARNDVAILQKRLDGLLDAELAKIDVDRAAAKFDEDYNMHVTDLEARIADPNHKADNKHLDGAIELYRRMMKQDMSIRNRLKHEDMAPTALSHLRMLYTEAMVGLHLDKHRLFGTDGKSGRLGKYRNSVLRPNNALGMYLTRFIDVTNDAAIINAAQSMDKIGTVFDGLDPAVRAAREADLITAVRALVEDDAGIFRDGQGGSGDIGRPILVARKSQEHGADFVDFHIPRLNHTLDNGKVINGKLVDTGEVFTLPKVFFASKNKGRGAAIRENTADGLDLLETGSLNGMADIYPNARFYSEKVAETGRQGVRQNERQIKTEHTIAASAIREHSLAQAIRSQVNYFVNKVMLDMNGLAESQAVLVPASEVVGKSHLASGYRVLHTIRTFDNINDARDFAKLRGVEKEFEDAAALYEQGLLSKVSSTIDVAAGMGVRDTADGGVEFIVRGGVMDWAGRAIDESLDTHSALPAFKDAMYSDPVDIPDKGFVLAVPNQVDRQLGSMVINGNDFASRLLTRPLVKGPTNIFKWLVLNANAKFISNNVIGGISMMMIYNPSAAVNILTRSMQSIARKGGDTYLSNVVNESRAVKRALQYEYHHNVYRSDAGVRTNEPQNIKDLSNKHAWFRKYIQNFGYTTVGAFEEFVRNNVAIDYLKQDAGMNAFMESDVVKTYIEKNQDWDGNIRSPEDPISPFEAASDLLLDRNSPYFDAQLKHRMRYATNTVSGNYHRFGPVEQLMRNFMMPFYAWQRHSATFTYRLAIDRPITANVLYNVGQFGYVQAAESGVPDYMMMTVPLPEVLKEKLGITAEDFRLDANALSPFSTTGDMAAAAIRLLTGTDLGSSVFEFANPYVNAVIKDTLGVDPRSGKYDFSGEQSGKGIPTATWDMFKQIGVGTYAGRGKSVYDAIENGYQEDSLANKYYAVDNAADILRNEDPGDKFSDWKLSIPEMKASNTNTSLQNTVINALGIKTYDVNLDAQDPAKRAEMVGAYVLNKVNQKERATSADRALNGVRDWQRRRDYVMQVTIPALEAQGADPSIITKVLMKIEDEKPNSAKSLRILQMLGG